MPDGYGNNMPSWALTSPKPTYNDKPIRWMLARHMREDHGMPLHVIARRTGIPYKEVREEFNG